MDEIRIGKNTTIVYHNGRFYQKRFNDYTGSLNVVIGIENGDEIEFTNGQCTWNPTKDHLEVLFGKKLFK